MQVGIWIDLRNPEPWRKPWAWHYGRTLELIEEAERLGVDTVQLTEHHFFGDGYLPQPLTFAAAIAGRTSRIRIGTSVLLPALYHPVSLAEQANIVDLLSDGRLDLGFGVGYRSEEFAAFGTDVGRRFGIFEDRIHELRGLWSDGRVTPPSIQQPIPLWGGVAGPRGARIAGRLGLGLLTLRPDPWTSYLTGLREGGHSPEAARVAGGFFAVLADDPESNFADLAPHIEHFWNSYNEASVEGTDRPPPPHMTAEDCRRAGAGSPPGFEVLTPGEAAALVDRLANGRSFEGVWLWASVAGMPEKLVLRNLELVAGEFKSLVNGKTAPPASTTRGSSSNAITVHGRGAPEQKLQP